MLPSVIGKPAGCLGFTRSLIGAVAQAPTNHLFLVGFNRSSGPFLVSSCARADLSNGRMRTPGQGLLAKGAPPSIQQRVHVKTGAFASNVLQSCVSCRLILKSFSPPLAATMRWYTPSSRMLPSVMGGRRTYTTWIGELLMLSFAVKSPCICQPRWNVIRSSS